MSVSVKTLGMDRLNANERLARIEETGMALRINAFSNRPSVIAKLKKGYNASHLQCISGCP